MPRSHCCWWKVSRAKLKLSICRTLSSSDMLYNRLLCRRLCASAETFDRKSASRLPLAMM